MERCKVQPLRPPSPARCRKRSPPAAAMALAGHVPPYSLCLRPRVAMEKGESLK